MFKPVEKNIMYCFILLSLSAALSACGSSSSSSSTTIPSSKSVYYAHNLVFRNGTTVSTGYNAFGQLGTGNLDQRSVPGTLSQYYPFKGFATGGNHSVAFINNSTVRSWGCNYTGELGIGTTTYSSVPVKTGDISGVKAVAAGESHSLALTSNGTLWAWGNNGYGQLGYSTATVQNGAISDLRYSTIPKSVFRNASGAVLSNISAIAANGYNSMALQGGDVLAWGYNYNGQLGFNPVLISSVIPLKVPGLPSGVITGIAAGSAFSYAVANGNVWAWGNNSNGQLGNGTVLADSYLPDASGLCKTATTSSYQPVRVVTSSGAPLTDVVQVAAGYHHGLARDASGFIWGWGANLFGQLGTNEVTGNSCFAVKVQLKDTSGNYLKAENIRTFGSSSMAMVRTSEGKEMWYVWGNNLFGQLGVGTEGYNSTVSTPVKMSGF